MRLLITLFLLSLSIKAQTLDNTLGTEERQQKKIGWITEGPGSHEFFFVAGNRYTGAFDFFYDTKEMETQANFKNGSFHGMVTEFKKEGSVKSVGRYKNGNKVGKWLYYYDNVSFEEKVYSRREPNQVRKSLFVNSSGIETERFKTQRNMRFTKFHLEYHATGNLKLKKTLINRFKVIYEIEEFYENTKLNKHYFLKYDDENEEWDFINEYKEYNKNGKLLIHEYH